MNIKRVFTFLLGVILFGVLFTPGHAQMKKICKFKGVNIPFDLMHEDELLAKGKYDLEIMKDMNQQMFYLRIKKKGKTICNLTGEKQRYKDLDIGALMTDPNIPDNPKLSFQRIPVKKVINIIFESGKRINKYPCIKVKFHTEYEE